jgi:hypothetical protein
MITKGTRVDTPDGPATVISADEMASGLSIKVELDRTDVTASGAARYPAEKVTEITD